MCKIQEKMAHSGARNTNWGDSGTNLGYQGNMGIFQLPPWLYPTFLHILTHFFIGFLENVCSHGGAKILAHPWDILQSRFL